MEGGSIKESAHSCVKQDGINGSKSEKIEMFVLPDDVEISTHSVEKNIVTTQESSDIRHAEIVNDVLLPQVLDYGFDADLALLAIQQTRGAGLEPAINWIIQHLDSAAESSQQSSPQLLIDGKYVSIDCKPDEQTLANFIMGSRMSSALADGIEPSSSSSSSSSNSILRAVRPPRMYKMIFVANMSLKMGAGKLAAQVGHATLGVYRQTLKTEEGKKALKKWSSHGEVKIVVKGQSTEQLMNLHEQANKANVFTYLVQDAGYTQIPPGSRTVLGIFGAVDAVDNITGSLKLL